jgi:hypothetical protein
VSAERILAFEQLAGKRIMWVYFSDNRLHGIHFPDVKVRAIWSVHHAIPFIRMMARANGDQGCTDKTYALAKIDAGRFDAQLHAYARAAAATRIPLMIRLRRLVGLSAYGAQQPGDPWTEFAPVYR